MMSVSTECIVSNIRINALFKWLHQVTPEDGPMVLDIMRGVIDSIENISKYEEDRVRYDRLISIMDKLSKEEYNILPIKEEEK